MTNRTYFVFVILVAMIGLVFALLTVFSSSREKPIHQQLYPIAKSPFKTSLSAIGIVQASSENILIGTPVRRLVNKVPVTVGNKVKQGDILFTLDDRVLEAQKKEKEVAYAKAIAELHKMQAMPRREEVVPLEEQVKALEADLELAKNQYEMAKNLTDSRSISQEEFNKRRYHHQQTEAKLAQAKAELEKVKVGSWKFDLDLAEISVEQAKANLIYIQAEIDQTIVRSPIDGEVLQVNIHPGEMPPTDTTKNPLMILGNVNELNLRVEIDQFDAPYFQSNQPAVAYLQGNANIKVELRFVRIEPLLIAKQTFTNDISEKIDTKVLPVIYKFTRGDLPIYVGQQMDVFIKTQQPSESAK